ncbi:MAG: hypothetical protein LBQ31_06105 [Bacteroidales bacterium]|nr:hypothetical protein [Bacteroidales bacterium]
MDVENGIPKQNIHIRGRIIQSQATIEEEIEKGAKIYIKSTTTLRPTIKKSREEAGIKPPISLLSKKLNDKIPTNTDASAEIKELFDGINIMDYPKPTGLLKYIIDAVICNKKDSIILDFFAGSATTAHAVMQLNAENAEDGGGRKYIMVQLDEPTNPDSEARKAGYNTIDEIARERIKRAAKKIISENPMLANNLDLGFKHYRLKTPEITTIDKIIEFNPNIPELFNNDMISPFAFGNESGLPTLLQTWLIADGYTFQLRIKNHELRGYTAPYIEETGTIYLIDSGFGTEQLKELLNKIGKHELTINTIVIYPYSFTFEQMLELKNNIKNNLDKDNTPTIIERY